MAERGEILVEVKGISKKFSHTLKRSMMYGLRDVGNAMLGINKDRSVLRKGEFWAVKDVSFVLRRGECLGLIGRNGAGKSTLLKMLNGLIRPDEGSITMRGKIGALIELGAGFNPLLSGRENIYVNGQLLGFSKKEVDDKLDSIIEFSEISEFIDSPVQNYSSGMKIRLGFAVAAQMKPDVLIIDEVLAVGDLGFVLKCFNTIDTFVENTAVIFVSHSMPQVSRICSSVMLLEKGKTTFHSDDIAKGIDLYYSKFASKGKANVIFDRGEEVALLDMSLGNEKTDGFQDPYTINWLDDLVVSISIRIKKEYRSPFISMTISDKEQRAVGVLMDVGGLKDENIEKEEGDYLFYKVSVTSEAVNLSKGIYSISLSISEGFRKKPLLRLQSLRYFQVFSKNDIWPPVEFQSKWK